MNKLVSWLKKPVKVGRWKFNKPGLLMMFGIALMLYGLLMRNLQKGTLPYPGLDFTDIPISLSGILLIVIGQAMFWSLKLIKVIKTRHIEKNS